jgi:hypothetical protein
MISPLCSLLQLGIALQLHAGPEFTPRGRCAACCWQVVATRLAAAGYRSPLTS